MFLLGELTALFTAACWSVTAILISFGGRHVGSDVVNRTRLLFALGLLTITHLILEGTIFPFDAEPFRWGWFALSSVLGLVLGDTFLFRAFVLIGPRLSTLMMSSVPILSTFMAWLFLGETISLVESAGILITMAGIAWVVTEKRPGQRTAVENKRFSQGILFGVLGAFGQSSNLITAKFGLAGDYPTISATLIRILVAVVVLWLLAALRGQVVTTVHHWRHRRAFAAIVAGTVTGPFLGIWSSLVAIQLTRVGIASTLMALPPVLLIPIEFVLFRQRVSRRGVLGTAAAFAGVAIILL